MKEANAMQWLVYCKLLQQKQLNQRKQNLNKFANKVIKETKKTNINSTSNSRSASLPEKKTHYIMSRHKKKKK